MTLENAIYLLEETSKHKELSGDLRCAFAMAIKVMQNHLDVTEDNVRFRFNFDDSIHSDMIQYCIAQAKTQLYNIIDLKYCRDAAIITGKTLLVGSNVYAALAKDSDTERSRILKATAAMLEAQAIYILEPYLK